MPITSDGKEPDLTPFLHEISTAVSKAVRKATHPGVKEGMTQKAVMLANLDAVKNERLRKASEELEARVRERTADLSAAPSHTRPLPAYPGAGAADAAEATSSHTAARHSAFTGDCTSETRRRLDKAA